jgi:hypothetical protein
VAQLLGGAGGLERQLEVVHHGQKLLDHVADGIVAKLEPLALGALAGVFKLGLQAGQAVDNWSRSPSTGQIRRLGSVRLLNARGSVRGGHAASGSKLESSTGTPRGSCRGPTRSTSFSVLA